MSQRNQERRDVAHPADVASKLAGPSCVVIVRHSVVGGWRYQRLTREEWIASRRRLRAQR